MHATVTRIALAVVAATAIACGGIDQGDSDVNPPPTMAQGEAVGTSGISDRLITVGGCITKANPDGYVLTSADDAIVRQETGTAGHHRDDEDTAPHEPNRGAEDERLRHTQNPSVELGRYRLEGDAERIAMLVNREVEIQGRVNREGVDEGTPATLIVDAIDATGPSCGSSR